MKGVLNETSNDVLLLDLLTETTTKVWLRSPETLRHKMKLSDVHDDRRIAVPDTALDFM